MIKGATTFSKLGVQFLGLEYYYSFTEKIDRSTQFGAVGYIITLYSSNSYVKSWGPSKFWGSPEPQPSSGCAHGRDNVINGTLYKLKKKLTYVELT